MPYINKAKIPTASTLAYSTLRIQAVSSDPAFQPTSHGGVEGDFREPCSVSHFAFNDPIVFPGQPGVSHLHMFYGNTATDANSTADSLANSGGSTCAGGIGNRSGYWMPALIDTLDGTPQVPTGVQTYYKSGPHPGSQIQSLPTGLRMIAGNSKATTAAATNSIATRFVCISSTSIGPSLGYIPGDCAAGSQVWAMIVFPSCWDGVNLDSPDHKSHMSYAVGDPSSATGQGCPSTHPVKLPEITMIGEYLVPTAGAAARWRFSSDNYDPATGPGGYSSHADWFNGWQPSVVKTWTTNCLNKQVDCHSYILGDGTMLY